jgi:hypothetical protein
VVGIFLLVVLHEAAYVVVFPPFIEVETVFVVPVYPRAILENAQPASVTVIGLNTILELKVIVGG